MWLIRAFWRLCGVFTIDLSYNKFQNAYSALLIASCVYNFVNASQVICKVDHWCSTFSSTLTAVYDRVLTSAVFLSRIAVVYACKPNMSRYRATIRAFEAYSPPSPTELRRHRAFSLAVVAACLAVIVPTNSICMYYLCRYEPNSDASLFVYQLFMYVQNLSMCCIETQFVVQCFKVYTKFHGINGDLKRLKDENLNRSEYPFMSSAGSPPPPTSRAAVVYDKDFYRPRFMSHPTANTVELLRIKHWLIRLSIDALNNLFGVHMGLSVFYLWLMALFDIYYEMFHKSRSGLLVYCWLLQYTLRLLLIILMAHFTTKQALEAKSLIADTNNGTMDSSTKEELQLFINQIYSSTTEFNAYDFFTLNTQVIKSAIAAGATCLVILVQFHSERN
ncbi:uncharacterized protein LOC100575410 [Acyrthosiphon pisum]|uniref:Gustatory receptor n=1 Tax=Acyrthosiphon pisum TaxID=7029 RepID=A0A8R2NQ24_ACYPI|nr:uncharacterized protein LOC100575410 [Acyrthosiphon pisum]|eukprot:XP_003246397.2 PREDICTED: uncharacterized protein LOC100575410 [Acyrthosiphon pisum]